VASATGTFAAPDGAALAYSDAGAGLAVLCLSGLTRTMADFDPMVPHLPPCRLIRMDYRGRGASAWTGAATYTVETEAGDALALLDHLGVDRAALIGTSRGGLIGMHLAVTARDRLIGLCLNDIGPVLDRAALDRIADYVGQPPGLHSHAELAARLARSPGFDAVPPGRWLEEAGRRTVETPEGLRNRYDPALRDAFRADLDRFAAPAWAGFEACAGLPLALIRGANSRLLTAATAAEMARRRPDMIRAEVPGRAHVPFLDEPESLAAIRAFLALCGCRG
jgi:pimeloyl-ACP methyl ester carboxylesterase